MEQPGPKRPVAVVTGANRGIGLEVTRQLADRGFVAVLGSRDAGKGRVAASGLRSSAVVPHQLDVDDEASVRRLTGTVEADHGVVDVLVNNAAILYDTWERGADADLDVVRRALETNLLGAWRMCQTLLPLLRRSPHPRIVNVSSGAGSFAEMGPWSPAYSVSKASLNAMTRILAADLRSDGILVNAVCPGWVATDMGGPGGRPLPDGAAGVVWAATLPDDGPTGGFFRDQRPIPW